MGSREMTLLAIASIVVAIIVAASAVSGRADVQLAIINSSTQFMGTLRHISNQYIGFSNTQDLQNISMEAVKVKIFLKAILFLVVAQALIFKLLSTRRSSFQCKMQMVTVTLY